MTEFMNMITSDKSLALRKYKHCSLYYTRTYPSTTSGNSNNDISLDTTEESTQATTGISTETEAVMARSNYSVHSYKRVNNDRCYENDNQRHISTYCNPEYAWYLGNYLVQLLKILLLPYQLLRLRHHHQQQQVDPVLPMHVAIPACAAAEYDKEANVCTLKGECTNKTQYMLDDKTNGDQTHTTMYDDQKKKGDQTHSIMSDGQKKKVNQTHSIMYDGQKRKVTQTHCIMFEDQKKKVDHTHSIMCDGHKKKADQTHSIMFDGQKKKVGQTHSKMSDGQKKKHDLTHSIMFEDQNKKGDQTHSIMSDGQKKTVD
ncbi:unnamed protein product [Mytilus edulis]|uniref:Uncharacterized protein n=1 Tax=Mytilus edulis TaxID=6550 RepID=A0A8S3R8Y0_MYTED|nr:unnamed protein product [Mytilus edulis]